MIGSSNDVKPLAISAAVATFAVALPIMTGGVCLARTSSLIIDRYGFPKRAKKTLTIKKMREAALLAQWVAPAQEHLR
jgi:hypothetical protein